MKKFTKLFVVGMLALTLIVGQVGSAVAAVSQSDLIALLEEEMTAEYLYSELYKQYPENKLFLNLAQSEARHSEALRRAFSRMGISVEEAKASDVAIPESKEEALVFALAFELEDIEMLENLIETVEDAGLQRVLENLLRGSTQHHKTLEKAIEEGIDNLVCNEERGGQNRPQSGGQAGRQGKGNGRHTNGSGCNGFAQSEEQSTGRGRNRVNNQRNNK
jgi:hypothetical protein